MSDGEDDITTWCDEHLPDLYDVGMYDSEDISEEVWEDVNQSLQETVLDYVEDPTDLCEQMQEAAADWFRTYHALMIKTIPESDPAIIATLQTKPQVEQHSAEWYAQRRNRLTASEFAHILDGRRGSLLRSKIAAAIERPTMAPVAIAQPDGEMNATLWGHRFEPIVRRIYEQELAGADTVCDTLGRFTHHTIPWLSASPDGVVLHGPLMGRLVEIKAPKSRQPGEFVPSDYYVQMQIQMEVTDLDAVDFVEAQFTQRPTKRHGMDDNPLSDKEIAVAGAAAWKGRVEVWGDLDDQTTWVYRYTPPVEDLTDAVFNVPAPEGLRLLEHSVWWLTGWYPRTVLRNNAWWESIGWPAAEQFWAEVESLRSTPIPEGHKGAAPAPVGGWMGR